MALTEQEQQEIAQLEAKYGTESVFSPVRQQPGFLSQFGQATLQSLPEIGGLVGGIAGAMLTRSPIGAQSAAAAGRTALTSLGRGLTGTGVGTVAGTAVKQQVDAILDRPQPLGKALAEQLSNAATNVALDAAGNLLFNLAGKAYKVGKDRLPSFGLFERGIKEQDLKSQVQRLLETEGGGLTRYQVSQGPIASVAESIGRAGVFGRTLFTQLEEANLKALRNARDNVLDEVSSRFVSDIDAGASYKDIISNGQDALSAAVKPFYENLAGARPGVAAAALRIAGDSGLPVSTRGIAESARNQLSRAEAISKTGDPNLSLGSEVVTELKRLSEIKDNISFAEAHDFRSKLGARLRAIRDEFGPNSPQVALLSKTMKDIDSAMDSAASSLNPALKAQYDETSKFYREGINELFPKTLAKLNRTTAERLGETVFKSGNVSEVLDFYKSLDRAKKLNPELDTAAVRESIQRGYLSSLIGEEGADVSVGSLLNLGKKLQEDKKFKRTFDAALDPSVRNNVELLANAARIAQTKPQNTFSLAINTQQADAVRGVVQGLLAAGGAAGAYSALPSSELGTVGAVLGGAGVLLTPKALAKFATNKEAINSLLSAEKSFRTISTLPAEQQRQALIKTISLMNAAYDRAGVVPQDLAPSAQPTTQQIEPTTPSQLSPEEEKELRSLESKYQ